MPAHFISLQDVSPYEFSTLLDLARDIKNNPVRYKRRLEDTMVGWITRPEKIFPPEPSFHVAAAGLGGKFIPFKFPFHQRDPLFSLRHLEKWMDILVAEALPHSQLTEWSENLSIPVINSGSDRYNPCRAAADLFTLKEWGLDLNFLKIVYIGGKTPVLHSLIHGLAKTGSHLHIACPKGKEPDQEVLNQAEQTGNTSGFSYSLGHDPGAAVNQADVLYTDSGWNTNTGEEKFHITPELLRRTGKEILIFHGHSLSAGEEISRNVIKGPQSAVLKQWENTLHIQKAIMVSLVKIMKLKK